MRGLGSGTVDGKHHRAEGNSHATEHRRTEFGKERPAAHRLSESAQGSLDCPIEWPYTTVPFSEIEWCIRVMDLTDRRLFRLGRLD